MKQAWVLFITSLIGISSFAQLQNPPQQTTPPPTQQSPAQKPDPQLTPGMLCTKTDSDFKGLDYPEQIARCNRNISEQEKMDVANRYGQIPRQNWPQYEFDHLIPLCAGGTNNSNNLWPEPIDQAHKKDVLENDICLAMKAGTLKQQDAVQKVHDWFSQNQPEVAHIAFTEPTPVASASESSNANKIICSEVSPTNTAQVSLAFEWLTNDSLTDVKIKLIENGKEADIESTGNKISHGSLSSTANNPLKDFMRYSIKETDDRFYLYLPQNKDALKPFEAYIKVAFEGTYPKLVKLNCH